jgi:hypothetical protein
MCALPDTLLNPLLWQWSNPRPQGNMLTRITYTNDLFLAVGLQGTLRYAQRAPAHR